MFYKKFFVFSFVFSKLLSYGKGFVWYGFLTKHLREMAMILPRPQKCDKEKSTCE